jgi:hypothetical protein
LFAPPGNDTGIDELDDILLIFPLFFRVDDKHRAAQYTDLRCGKPHTSGISSVSRMSSSKI